MYTLNALNSKSHWILKKMIKIQVNTDEAIIIFMSQLKTNKKPVFYIILSKQNNCKYQIVK